MSVSGDRLDERVAARVLEPLRHSTWKLALVASVPTAVGPWLGYGTDIDVTNVLRAGRSAFEGDYVVSRPPGAFPHEVATWALDTLGGSVAVGMASVLLGFCVLWGLGWLVAQEGRSPVPTVLLVASNPWWWVAATSLGDFIWALAAVVGGAVLSRKGHRGWAGVAFGLAIGMRASSVVLVVAWLAAEQLGSGGLRRKPATTTAVASRSATLTTAAVTVGTSMLLFVPSWLAADRSLAFVDNELEVTGVLTLIGRWGVKNLAFFGPVVVVALLLGVRNTIECLRHWTDSTLVRFGALGFVGTQLLFLRFPWKPLHLLPALVCLALVLAPSVRRHWHVVLIAGGLLHGVVTITVAAPDVPHRATSAELAPSIVPGVIVNDVRCRLDDRRDGPWPEVDDPGAHQRAEALFDCQARTWRAPTDGVVSPSAGPPGCCHGDGVAGRLRRCFETPVSACRATPGPVRPP